MSNLLVPVFGGLGNQMFQVAHGIALSRKLGVEVKFTDLTSVTGRVTRQWELACFNIPKVPISYPGAILLRARLSAARRLRKLHPALHLNVLDEASGQTADSFTGQIKICSGYWQGERFFADHADAVKAQFTFPSDGADDGAAPGGQARVAVHVRRGDYLTDPVARAYHLVCDEDWYRNSIDEMRRKQPGAQFHFFSDDPDWTEETFAADDIVVRRGPADAPAWMDMAAMSRCNHWIISNSSYSWWASYLGKQPGSTVIAPKNWFASTATKDLPICCDDWICL